MGSMSTQTITEFLEARIAEDERAAQAWSAKLTDDLTIPAVLLGGIVNPSKALAECAAKRAIIRRYDDADESRVALSYVVEALAAVYADHPDYQQKWAL